jgi:ATP-dependent Clp protease adaptor protein ClpS
MGEINPPYMIGDKMAAVDTVKQEKVVVSLQPPSFWKVIFLNDDKTPMDLVIYLLTSIFKHDQKRATEITMEIHNTGSGIAGVYTFEIAEQLGLDATKIARENGSPLKIQVEQE